MKPCEFPALIEKLEANNRLQMTDTDNTPVYMQRRLDLKGQLLDAYREQYEKVSK